jgi:hypothetical protein
MGGLGGLGGVTWRSRACCQSLGRWEGASAQQVHGLRSEVYVSTAEQGNVGMCRLDIWASKYPLCISAVVEDVDPTELASPSVSTLQRISVYRTSQK